MYTTFKKKELEKHGRPEINWGPFG